MNLSNEALQFVGALLAAMVAGWVSLVVTILAKEQKTSEFRQAWIDALRQELSDFAAAMVSLADSIRLKLASDQSKAEIRNLLLNERSPEVKQLEALRVRILLRLNPKEHQALIDLVRKAYDYSPAQDLPHTPIGDKLVTDFVQESQRVLKAEWRRVKRGELAYQVIKWFSLAVFVVAVCLVGSYWSGHFKVLYAP